MILNNIPFNTVDSISAKKLFGELG